MKMFQTEILEINDFFWNFGQQRKSKWRQSVKTRIIGLLLEPCYSEIPWKKEKTKMDPTTGRWYNKTNLRLVIINKKSEVQMASVFMKINRRKLYKYKEKVKHTDMWGIEKNIQLWLKNKTPQHTVIKISDVHTEWMLKYEKQD